MKIQNKKFIASILFVLISFVCVAQITDNPQPPPPAPPGPPGFPIDDAIPFVLVLAIFYGTRIVLKQIKKVN